jgi:hypothetical protein
LNAIGDAAFRFACKASNGGGQALLAHAERVDPVKDLVLLTRKEMRERSCMPRVFRSSATVGVIWDGLSGSLGASVWNKPVSHHFLLNEGETAMKDLLRIAAFTIAIVALPVAAQAKGCIKGAIVGGVAGHYVGHGKMGALAGCVIRHSRAAKRERMREGQVPSQM